MIVLINAATAIATETEPPVAEPDVVAKAEQAAARENSNNEDPLATRQAEKIVAKEQASELEDRPSDEEVAVDPTIGFSSDAWNIDWYFSPRVRYQTTNNETALSDDTSRAGISGDWQFANDKHLFGRFEAGFDLMNSLSFNSNPGGKPSESDQGDEVFTRLSYIGIDLPSVMASYGKNWSTYYQVAGFTDRFDGSGGAALGTFNADTDGGATGTGRPDQVIQARVLIDFLQETFNLKPFNLNVQYQNGEPIPHTPFKYDNSWGASAVLEMQNNLSIGLAYNRANVHEEDLPDLEAFGIEDDATAALIGAKWFNPKWSVGAAYARLKSHEATDQNLYFDADGIELYAQRQIRKNLWAVAGLNWLEPDSDQDQAGDFEIQTYIFGLRYLHNDFNRMAYIEYQWQAGAQTDGKNPGSVFTVGFRWDFPAPKG